jgi:hypothetical protein
VLKAAYKLAIGGWSVDSVTDPRTELVELDVFRTLNSPGDNCRISVYAPAPSGGGGLEELALAAATAVAGEAASALGLGGGGGGGGPSVQLRGQAVAAGDALTVDLTCGDVSGLVMTAEVRSVESSLGTITVLGRSATERLATTRVNAVYENQSLDQIVGDLANQAGVQVGNVDPGSTYAYLVAHESRNVFRTLLDLAGREGMDLGVDTSNQLRLTKFAKATADHAFRYAAEVLDVWLDAGDPTADHVLVHGESPASTMGNDTSHWLVRDLTPFRGESGNGVRTRGLQDGAVRTKDLAGTAAAARLGAIRDGARSGRVVVLGNPTVDLGDAVEIREAPRAELNGLFKVVSVRHIFSKRDGFVTVVGFTGHGAAGAAGGLLGAAGSLAGAAAGVGISLR